MAQSIHAVAELCRRDEDWAIQWKNDGNVIIVLESLDVASVWESLGGFRLVGGATFREPDFDDAFTALAVYTDAFVMSKAHPSNRGVSWVQGMLKGLPLAGSKPRWRWQERRLQRREAALREKNHKPIDWGNRSSIRYERRGES
jgi:hypothetical protein